MRKLILVMLFASIPSLAFAQDEKTAVDPYRVPRMGLEVGTLVGHSWFWNEGYESGWQVHSSLGFGVIEEHGGAMLRYAFGGVGTSLFGDKRLENTHNLSALVWMPFKYGSRMDTYLAAGPLLQWATSPRNTQVFTGVVAEAGFDLLTELRFLRFRYAVRTQLTGAGADVLLTLASSFWSWPL